MTDNLVERLRDEWLRKATSSFTCQECGIQANFIDEIENALDAKDKRIAELEAALVRLRWAPVVTAELVRDVVNATFPSRLLNKEDRNG
jgi:hypothetical protein